jgi:hypothetical protein
MLRSERRLANAERAALQHFGFGELAGGLSALARLLNALATPM